MTKKMVDGILVDMLPDEEAQLVALLPTKPLSRPVTKTQALIALQRAGKLDAVKAAVATDPENQIWFDTAQTWHRDNPRVQALAPAVGLTDKDLDDLFALAATVTE
jgi:hypothetical protein